MQVSALISGRQLPQFVPAFSRSPMASTEPQPAGGRLKDAVPAQAKAGANDGAWVRAAGGTGGEYAGLHGAIDAALREAPDEPGECPFVPRKKKAAGFRPPPDFSSA